MNVLVCVTKTPDTTAKIGFVEQNTRFDISGVQFIMNPYDEWYALVRALELKEAQGGKVTLISVGGADCDQVIRKGLAIGADEAVRIDVQPVDAYQVATEIATYVKANTFDIVFTGKESIESNGSEVGAMIAEILDWPFLSYASKMDMEGPTATVDLEIEGGEDTVQADVPFVISAAKGLAEQRIPNMRGIMMAKSKPLQVVPGSGVAPRTAISSYTMPKEKSAVHLVDPENMSELVRLLKEEAKVI
ncbi:MAG: electron transfer flavoprotein subunit beta/FixA family protein [Saprospiraceae bacterium]|nr:electron transfer flavoprotein subunit beta/FixA family protein [Saprospiraceae bacterium]